MRYGAAVLVAVIFLPCIVCLAQSAPEGFVLIEGGEFRLGKGGGGPRVRVEDFEILDHPVTNAEYQAFVDTTGHPVSSRYVTAADGLDYRLWLGRNMGGGYASVYDRPLSLPRDD